MNESQADSQKMALSQYHDLSLHIKKNPFVDVHLQLLSLLLCDIGDQMDQLG